MQKVLIVENDVFLLTSLVEYLGRENLRINSAKTLTDAFKLVDSNSYDLIVSDRMLDDGDGIKLIEYLHSSCYTTKTLLLTQKNSLEERLEGLRVGADDYLGKPFSLKEFSLRVRNLLNKNKFHSSKSLIAGHICLMPDLGEVQLEDITVKLTPLESKVLACLLRYKNRTVTRDFLLEEVWRGKSVLPSIKSVDVYVRRIRMKMGAYGKLITTKYGFGYIVSDLSR